MADPWRVTGDPIAPAIHHYFPANRDSDKVGLEHELICAVARLLVQSWAEQRTETEVVGIHG